MRKPVSTKAHGIIDYMTAGLLVTLPRALGWSRQVTHLLDAAACTTVAYSVLTRYELGVVKALPMKAHLAIDAVQGGAMIGAAAFLEDEEPEVRATLAAIGTFELGVTLMTRTETDAELARRRQLTSSEPSMPQAPSLNTGASEQEQPVAATAR